MSTVKNENIKGFKVDCLAMALAYKEMGDLNLTIAKEMDYLEWEATRIIESFLEKMNALEI